VEPGGAEGEGEQIVRMVVDGLAPRGGQTIAQPTDQHPMLDRSADVSQFQSVCQVGVLEEGAGAPHEDQTPCFLVSSLEFRWNSKVCILMAGVRAQERQKHMSLTTVLAGCTV
jgi:hypothetical protein